jgi:hypothetical protein
MGDIQQINSTHPQFATSNSSAKMGLRYRPYAFTEHGAVAAAFILNSRVAVSASIQIVRTFNRLRQLAQAHKNVVSALTELSTKVAGHDEQFQVVFKALQQLMDPPAEAPKRIGFVPRETPTPRE